MTLMDTDNMTLMEQANPEAMRLRNRIAAVPPDDLGTTIVSYEEQTRGWFAVSAQARTPQAQVSAYSRLKRHLQLYSKIAVIDFDERAAAEFVRLKQTKIRIGRKCVGSTSGLNCRRHPQSLCRQDKREATITATA